MSQTKAPTAGALLTALIDRPWALPRETLATLAAIARSLPADQALTEMQAAFGDRSAERFIRQGTVAHIPVYGAITKRSSFLSWLFGGTSLDALRAALQEAVGDAQITAVLLEFDSPGGDVAGLTELAEEIRALRGQGKPIVAIANTLAASAAYWLASQADEVIVTPSGAVGSIGVYALHQDLSRAYDMAGITNTLISAGPRKTEGNEFEPLSDAARDSIQEHVDTYYAMFLADVAKGRRVSTAQVASAYGQGDVVLAREALAAGMVDRIATLEATIRRLAGSRATRNGQRAEGELELTTDVTTETDAEANADETPQPFAQRLSALTDEAAELVSHAEERARLRAKEGRPAFSTTTESALRTIRGQIDQLLATDEPEPSGEPAPTDEPTESAAPPSPAPAPVRATAPVRRFRSTEEWQHYLETNDNGTG